MENADRSKFDLLYAVKENGSLQDIRPAGHALKFDGTDYYVLKLWFLYGFTYFLVKNRADQTRYTLFTRKVDTPDGVRFQNPIGSASNRHDLKDYLEIKIPIFREGIFMSLFPDPMN